MSRTGCVYFLGQLRDLIKRHNLCMLQSFEDFIGISHFKESYRFFNTLL